MLTSYLRLDARACVDISILIALSRSVSPSFGAWLGQKSLSSQSSKSPNILPLAASVRPVGAMRWAPSCVKSLSTSLGIRWNVLDQSPRNCECVGVTFFEITLTVTTSKYCEVHASQRSCFAVL